MGENQKIVKHDKSQLTAKSDSEDEKTAISESKD